MRALFCTRCAVLVCGVVRDARALLCERVALVERAPFVALFVVLRVVPLDAPLVASLPMLPVALRPLSLRDATFREPLNSPGFAVAATAGRPWFTDAN
jgi:hypothetical protein